MKKVILAIAMVGLVLSSCRTKGKTEEVVNDTTDVVVDTVVVKTPVDTVK